MFAKIFGYMLVLLLLSITGYSTPAMEYDRGTRSEKYDVEHAISTPHAKNSALTSDINSIVIPPGCQSCTLEERRYCLGPDLINDHCCCDKRYREYLPFIPHTCYMGQQQCAPIVGDCAEYSRLRTCCCDKHVLEKWKRKFMGSSYETTSGKSFTLIFLIQIVHTFVYYLI